MFDLICQVLRDFAAQDILPAHLKQLPFMPQTRLDELGIDSLGLMTMLSELCGRLGIPLLDDVSDQLSLGELAERLEKTAA